MPRVLIACFALEANTFAPGETTVDDFRAQTFAIGADVGPTTLGPQSELAAAWRVLEEAGYDVVPALAAWSGPRQPMNRACLEEIVRLATAPADGSIDGAYVMLHGSAVAHSDDDPEGTLLRRMRQRLGPGKPITVSLDLHAHLTQAMVECVDGVAVYRTCPHLDTACTGERAARMLVDALTGKTRPVVAMAARPMITPPQQHDNELEPFRSLMRLSSTLEQDPLLSVGLLLVQPWIDVPELSWKAVATADADHRAAAGAAEALVAAAWEERHGFLGPPPLPIEAALTEALTLPPPVVLADSGDATNGGAIGDSTELLRAAARREGEGRVLLSVVAPEAALAARRAGTGAQVDVLVGGGASGAYNESVELHGSVVELYDGDVIYTHPVNAGYRASTGPAALIRSGTTDVVVHTRSVGVIDPALYTALGADPRDYAIVQAKSHVSYKAGFGSVSDRFVLAATGGPTTADLPLLDYRKRPRPLFPFELG